MTHTPHEITLAPGGRVLVGSFRGQQRRGSMHLQISAKLCHAARKAIGWTQDELAAAAGLTGMTVQSFERGARVPHQNDLAALRAALEGKGVQFLDPEEGLVGLQFPEPDKEE